MTPGRREALARQRWANRAHSVVMEASRRIAGPGEFVRAWDGYDLARWLGERDGLGLALTWHDYFALIWQRVDNGTATAADRLALDGPDDPTPPQPSRYQWPEGYER